jgi:hypothetical protein
MESAILKMFMKPVRESHPEEEIPLIADEDGVILDD